MIKLAHHVFEELVKLSESPNYKENFEPKLKDILGLSSESEPGDIELLVNSIDAVLDLLAKHIIQVRIGVEYGDKYALADIFKGLAKLRWSLMG